MPFKPIITETKTKELAAAVDLGSNSFRLMVAETDGKRISPIHKDLLPVRLAEGMQPTGLLQERAMNRGLKALHQFAKTLAKYAPLPIRVCGTAALRIAENSDMFVAQAANIMNCNIEIISGDEEASLSLAGVLSAVPSKDFAPEMILDVGGGSTEIILPGKAEKTQPGMQNPCNFQTTSFPVGAVNMTERFLTESANETEGLAQLNNYLEKIFLHSSGKNKVRSIFCPSPSASQVKSRGPIIASGGTATALAALDLNLSSYREELVQNHCLSLESLKRNMLQLLQLRPSDRNELAALHHGRGDIIVAGIQIHKTIMKLCKIPQLMVSDAGFIEGILLSSV